VSDLGIPGKMVRLHHALFAAGLPHAFGGALALAWCVGEVRATMDIDLNLFVGLDRIDAALEALPDGVTWEPADERTLHRDGQARLRWGRHPVDVFLNTTSFHEEAARRVRWEPFAGTDLPFLDCNDLAVFKAFLARPKDWVDLEEMARTGSVDIAATVGNLIPYLGAHDERIARLERLERLTSS